MDNKEFWTRAFLAYLTPVDKHDRHGLLYNASNWIEKAAEVADKAEHEYSRRFTDDG